jgi:hypothetical protein
MEAHDSFRAFSNPRLIAELTRIAHTERDATVTLIECLEEFDSRKLYLSEGFPSLFRYCTSCLGLCEYAAYARIEVARASRRFPDLLARLRDGRITLTNAGLLSPHLTERNWRELLDAAAGKTKEQVRCMIAAIKPQPAVPTIIKKTPAPRQAESPVFEVAAPAPVAMDTRQADGPALPTAPVAKTGPSGRGSLQPLSAETYKVQLTISHTSREQLREVQNLLRHSIPNGDAALIFERAIAFLLDHLRRQKFALTPYGRAQWRATAPDSRHIPATVKRAVALRDQGQCAYIGRQGRCPERGRLEYHHLVPFAAGGLATAENIELRCRAHNAHEAVVYFGEAIAGRRA